MRNVLAAMFMFALPVLILAQAPKSFEVASVQRHKPGDPGGTTNFPPGRYIATNLDIGDQGQKLASDKSSRSGQDSIPLS